MSDKICSAHGICLQNHDSMYYGPLDFELKCGEGALILAQDLILMRKLMGCFLGQVPAYLGQVEWWAGAEGLSDDNSLEPQRCDLFPQIGYVDRNCQLMLEMSLMDNLMLPYRYFQQTRGREFCLEILATLDLTGEENTLADDLPEPQRRLALYALALSLKPRLLLLERPAQFLDHDFNRIWETILLAASDRGLAYVVFDRTRNIYKKENFKVIENFSSIHPDSNIQGSTG